MRASVEKRPGAIALATISLVLGVVLLAFGVGVGVGGVAGALLIAGLVDRRLMLLAALLITPGLTAFNGIELSRIGGDVLDVRLLLTGTLAFVLWFWLVMDRPTMSMTARVFGLYVLAALLLTLLNDIAPLKALPVLARNLVYLGAFVGAQTWLGTSRGANAVLIAVGAGLSLPALGGVVQWATGGGLVAAGAWRLSGLYGASPVGMALAMALGVICLAGGALTEGVSKNLRWAVGILVLALMVILLAQTSSRLPFLATVAAVTVFEVARRRWLGIAVVAASSAILLASSAGLAARVGSTFDPSALPGIVHPQPSPGVIDPAGPPPPDGGNTEDVGGGAASLRYRLFVWRTMAPEWLESPLVGQGTGSFAALFERRTGAQHIAPHNDYLYALVEGGVVLLGLYVLLQAIVVLRLLHAVRSASDARLAVVALCLFALTNIANSINNAVFYVDLQLVVWTVTGAVLATYGLRSSVRTCDP